MQVIRLNRLNYMKNDFAYDPVTALSEVDAKGEIAVIFNDIKCTMQIPILTSIWRGLASIENGVSGTWRNIKPMYQTQAPFDTLANVLRKIDFIFLQSTIKMLRRCLVIFKINFFRIIKIMSKH